MRELVEEVLALAQGLGKVQESGELRALCAAAVEELTGRLREGVSPEACGGAFVLAAAWRALAGLELGDGVESFTAGEVSLRRGDAGARGEALRMQAELVMRPYVRDEGFAFRGVKG